MSSPLYLDYNATCPMDVEVKSAISSAIDLWWENPSGISCGGRACRKAIEEARSSVAKMINAASEEITFASGGTESNNMVIYSMLEEYQMYLKTTKFPQVEGGEYVEKVPHIITTNIEHPSIAKILDRMEGTGRCRVTRVPVQSTGDVTESAITQCIRNNTCLITMVWANEETGVIQPVEMLSKALEEQNASRRMKLLPTVRLHVDAGQTIGKIRVDVGFTNGIDFMTIVGHKFYGPRAGALFVRRGVTLYPMLFGGQQEDGRRPGMENTPMIVGLGRAADLVTKNQMLIMEQLKDARNHFEMRMKETFGDEITIHFEKTQRLPNTTVVTFKNIGETASDLLAYCSRLVASTGVPRHPEKPSPVLLACGMSEQLAVRTIRFSLGQPTSRVEIEQVIDELNGAVSEDKKRKHA